MRSVTATSRASPAAWPSVSLTTLKSSRSMNRIAVIRSSWPFTNDDSSVRSRLSWNIRRLAAPVRASRSARSWTWRRSTALRRLSAAIDPKRATIEATRRSTPGRRRPLAASTTMAPTGRPSAIIGATSRLCALGIAAARNGSTMASSRLTGRTSCRSQARATIQSGSAAVVGTVSVSCVASAIIRPSEAPRTMPRLKSKRSTRPASTIRACSSGSLASSSRPPTSTIDCRSERRWRSSRSLSAENADVAIANSQNDVTLRTGIRSNSMAAPATTSTGGTRFAAWA